MRACVTVRPLSVRLSVCGPVGSSVCRCVCLSMWAWMCFALCLSVSSFIGPSVVFSVCLSVCLYVRLSVRLSAVRIWEHLGAFGGAREYSGFVRCCVGRAHVGRTLLAAFACTAASESSNVHGYAISGASEPNGLWPPSMWKHDGQYLPRGPVIPSVHVASLMMRDMPLNLASISTCRILQDSLPPFGRINLFMIVCRSLLPAMGGGVVCTLM